MNVQDRTSNSEHRSRTRPACPAARRGFTLAELLAVLVIIMILMGMAVSSFYGMGRGARMRGAVSTFNATLSLARQYAVTRSAPLDVVLLEEDVEAGREAVNRYEVRRDGELFRPAQYLPSGIRFTDVQGADNDADTGVGWNLIGNFTFLPDGSLKGVMGELKIDLRDETQASAVKFTINGFTGLVRVTGD